MKKIVLGLLFMMSFSFATNEGAKELVNFLGFTGVSVSLDLAVFVTIILTLITWKITKDKEQNEIKEKYKDSARKSLLEYLGKLRDITKKLIVFKNQYNSLSDEEKMKLQLQNAHLISEYQKNLNEFLFISPIYSKKLYEILKDSMDDFEFAQKNGSIEIVVFSSVKTMGKLLVEYTEEEIANDLTKSIYGLTIEEAEKKLQESKNQLEKK